ncbi:MAG: helix-turn-helix transcriptional regulator [Clostridium celatum]|nr:helix-turn-helix transcriptional regulator [Clostridium celatum]MDU4979349.1 helix-turn-helix transcriptional regulator [Clostridium celatum]
MNIGANIKFIRIKENLTQKEFADLIGISRHGLINYENNKRVPPIDIIQKISDIFKVNLYDILETESYSEDFYKNIYKDLHNTTSIKHVLEIVFLHNEYLNDKLDYVAKTRADKEYFFKCISENIARELEGLEFLSMPIIKDDSDGKL